MHYSPEDLQQLQAQLAIAEAGGSCCTWAQLGRRHLPKLLAQAREQAAEIQRLQALHKPPEPTT